MATTAMATEDGLALAACALYGNRPSALLEVLHEIRARRGGITEADMRAVAGALNLSRAEVHGVQSFYPDLAPAPAGVSIRVCLAEACRSRGAAALASDLEACGVTAAPVYCLGNCALGPAIAVGDTIHGRADLAMALALVGKGAA